MTSADEPPLVDDGSSVDAAEVRRAMEFYDSRGWTDGLPVVPVTPSYLDEFLAATSRDPAEVILPLPHLNKNLTVRLAAVNAALAGCKPEYLPVVLAAWDAFLLNGMVSRAHLAVHHRDRAVLGAVRAGQDRARVQRPRQPVGVRVPGQRQLRPGHPARRAQRLRAEAAHLRPGDPGEPVQVLLLHRGERGGLPLAVPGGRQRVRRGRQRGGLRRSSARCCTSRPGTRSCPSSWCTTWPTRSCRTGALVRPVRDRVHRAQPRARPAVRQAWLVQGRRAAGDRRGGLADLPRPGRLGQGGDRGRHRLAAARRPPGRHPAGGPGRPGHARSS